MNRKKLDVELRNSLELYENSFEYAAVGIAHLSTDTKFIKVNKKFSDITGYSKKELSLLNLSLANIKDQDANNILTESINRIVSILTLHEYLYRSSDLNEINVQTYLYKILDHIRVSLNTDSRNVKIAKDIDNFMISSGMAISLGLIVNELVTNAVKYAFRDKEAGIINLEVKQINNNIILKIKDNGIGISENIDLENTGTLGFQITYSLESQYNGTIDYIFLIYCKIQEGL